MKLILVISLILALLVGTYASQLTNTMEALQMYQTGDGGLVDEQLTSATQASAKGNLVTTKQGVFLASLLGQLDKITLSGIGEFIKDRARQDGGYAETTDDVSDIIATRDIILIYNFLGIKTPNPQDILAFARSLYDEKTGLYAASEGEAGSIEATAAALQLFSLLGTIKAPFVTSNYERINQILKEALVETDTENFFSFPSKTLSAITANYYAIAIGYATEFDFSNTEKFANYFVTLQKSSGGFSSGDSTGNQKNTFESVAALAILSAIAKQDLISKINLNTLDSFLDSAGPKLSDIAYATQASVSSGSIKKLFKTELILESETGEPIKGGLVEGAKFRPTVRILGFEDLTNPRFTVELDTQFASEKDHFNMIYSKDKSKYVSTELFDTGKNLGQIAFLITARYALPTVGNVVLDFIETRTVGYRVEIAAKAFQEAAGKDISAGDSVSVGTEFTFDVTLFTAANQSPKVGKIEALLSVIDSSGAVVDEDKRVANSDDVITFTYTLKKQNLPSGALTFEVEIADQKVGVHSKGKVDYKLSSVLVASDIRFTGFERSKAAAYKIGEVVEVSMVPGVFGMSNVVALDLKDAEGNEIVRDFLMDVVSSSGARIHTLKGELVENSYRFSLSLAPRLDSFGANFISFRYVAKNGDDVEIQAYDSEFSELYEDPTQLNFTVPSDLRLVELEEAPTGDDFFYGNSIAFKFKLKDENSGEFVKAGNPGSTVYLSLVHKDEAKGSTFTSVVKPAVQTGDFFEINWRITPNAIAGPAEINLYAQGVNAQKLNILDSDGKALSYKVNIGGEIETTSNSYSSTFAEADKTTVVATFKLSCQGNPLLDAQLLASLVRSDGTVVAANLPVAYYKDSYQVSFTTKHDKFGEGSYKFLFFRDLSDSQTNVANQQPLFEINHFHQGVGTNSLPFSPQMVIVGLLIVGFGAIFMKRSEILATPN